VAKDDRFNSVDVKWDFIVVGTKVVGTPELERNSPDRPFGQIMNVKGIHVWALTWGEVLDNALHRLKFVRQHLEYQPSAAAAIRYLRQTHATYLPAVTVAKGAADAGRSTARDGAGAREPTRSETKRPPPRGGYGACCGRGVAVATARISGCGPG
jgi:hypothetical protein